MSTAQGQGRKRSPLGLYVELSVMMFVLFFVWGAWYVTMGTFMTVREFDARAIGWAYSVAPIAAIVTPFFMGVFADRFVNAEKLQGVLLILSGVFIAVAPQFAAPETQWIFVALLLGHTLCFMPNLGLSNTICLKHLADAEREYPIVRVFATSGWIVAGWVVSLWFQAEETPVQFYTAAAAAFAVGLYSFRLPRTPPPGRGAPLKMGELCGVGTWPYFRKRAFAVFMVASLFASMGMMPYWVLGSPFVNFLGIERSGAFFTMGQMAELVVLAVVLPVFIKRFGIKWTMIAGLLCWAVRFALFSGAATSTGAAMMTMLVVAVLLHGFSYDFVFVSGYLYVDKHVGEAVRAQAQGLLVVFTQGIGFFLSSQIFVGWLGSRYGVPGEDAAAWRDYWLVPSLSMAAVLVLFWVFFREKKSSVGGPEEAEESEG
ncbi:MAG: MFS transporter [Verrucomicrobiota bacterium]